MKRPRILNNNMIKEEESQATPIKNLNTTDEEDMNYEVDENIAYATSHKKGSANKNDSTTLNSNQNQNISRPPS